MWSVQKKVQIAAWSISFASVTLAIIVWGQHLRWHIIGSSTYLLFPIFGLVAFSLLWSQYISSATRQYFKLDRAALASYFKVNGYLVLAAILLHPGLLIWQLWRDGGGFPPGSYLHYVLPGLKFAVILGTINLTILLLFETRRVFAKYPWWQYFRCIVDLVMFSVFYHALRLGTQLHTGWYRKVWYFYGLTLLIALIYTYKIRFSRQTSKKP
jgi:hypothetical protein